MSGLSIKKRWLDNLVVLDLEGSVDLETAPKLRKSILKSLGEDSDALVLNFSGVTQIGMAGVATLIEASQLSAREKKGFTLHSLQDPVLKVFEVARLKEGFFLLSDEASAAMAADRMREALKNREKPSKRKRSA
jgi:anti-sigma B factor antagonist